MPAFRYTGRDGGGAKVSGSLEAISLDAAAGELLSRRITPLTIEPEAAGRARIRLHQPQRAVTPGQACVAYQDDLVLGGGWIARGACVPAPTS